jgi:predicted methyltransferase
MMKLPLLATIFFISTCIASCAFVAGNGSTAISAALTHSDRPAADRDQDSARLPQDVLQLAGIEPGMQIADLMAGSGWYSEIMARVVGSQGHVYAHNNATSTGIFGEALSQRLDDSGLNNVTSIVSELEAPNLPSGQLDAVFMVKFYHDTFWMEVDRATMNAKIFESLKPGGIFLVIDHSAEAGSEDRDTAADGLHRVDPALVRREVMAAGFELEASSNLLENPDDEHVLNVFDPVINGNTDRFLFTFRKPE